MNFQLITELPSWWIIFCLLAGIVYALVLYRGDRSFHETHKWLRILLFVLRSVVVFILALLLLSPLIKNFVREKEKPLLIIAQDNSQSIVLNKDSSFYRNPDGYRREFQQMADKLNEKFEVKTVSWGDRLSDELSFTYDEKQTDFSSLQKQLFVRYGNRNIGALVIASDGLYNRGSSPLYNQELKVPVYTVALGDTTVQKDLLISKVNFNKVVYLGNSFPVEVTINARQCSGEKSVLTIQQDSVVVLSREVSISGNRFSQLIPFMLDAKKKGVVHYKIKLKPLNGEMTTINNEQDIYIEVVDSKQKILIVGNAPHPDLGALKTGIESSENYSAKVILAPQEVNVKEYNLVILHNLPSATNAVSGLLAQISSSRTPVWFIVGTQTSLPLFNNLSTGLSILNGSGRSNRTQAIVNPNFSRFNVSDEIKRMLPVFPPLLTPFGQFRQTTDNGVFLQQQIGAISTDAPLQVFNEAGDYRQGVLCGEGVWQWRLSDYSTNGNFNVFHEWLLKTIQNLSVKENRTHFRLIHKNNFAENEAVTFDAEAYNDNYELVNTPDVSIVLRNESGKSFSYQFSKTENSYTLNAGFLPAGRYNYKATVTISGKVYQSAGEISVSALQVEQTETVADHRLMFSLAEKNGGKMYYPGQLEQLTNDLLSRDDIKTITYSHYKLRDLIEWKLIFFLLLGLLTLEWFLRKRAGGY